MGEEGRINISTKDVERSESAESPPTGSGRSIQSVRRRLNSIMLIHDDRLMPSRSVMSLLVISPFIGITPLANSS